VDRREFLLQAAGVAAGAFLTRRGMAQAGASTAAPTGGAAGEMVSGEMNIDLETPGHLIPENFSGLSYELAQLTDPNFFAASNKELIALFRLLSPAGVLRLGGNSSETCWLRVEASTEPPEAPKVEGPADQHWMPSELFEIKAQAVDNLGEFMKATGWQLIYGLNFGHSSPERLAREAEYIAGKAGGSVLYFQIGNEPDFYSAANNRTRPANWGFADYMKEWLACAEAILQRVPEAKFGGPDVGSTSNWISQFIRGAAEKLGKHLVAASGHYYAEGPPDDPRVTTSRLLRTNPQIGRSTKTISELAARNGLVYRMTEGNSCYRGGKPGMSDAFASALWAGDYMLALAASGCAGVNLHGGSRSMLRASLGNHMPGETVAAPGSDAKGGYYTPIAGELNEGFKARPIFYGMCLANQFAGMQFKSSTLSGTGMDATAYAAEKDGEVRLAVFNKDSGRDLKLAVGAPAGIKQARIWRLTAPGLDSTAGVTLAGSEVSGDATWKPAEVETAAVLEGKVAIEVPRDSAVLAFLNR